MCILKYLYFKICYYTTNKSNLKYNNIVLIYRNLYLIGISHFWMSTKFFPVDIIITVIFYSSFNYWYEVIYNLEILIEVYTGLGLLSAAPLTSLRRPLVKEGESTLRILFHCSSSVRETASCRGPLRPKFYKTKTFKQF